jgi:two-component system, cell cycle response regulator
MSPPVRVALLGFTPFEREYLEPALRAPRKRQPAYTVRVDDLPSCNLAVVDADHEPAVFQVLRQHRLASTVMVGSTPRPGAGAQLARPIQARALLNALDALSAASPAMSAEVQKVQEALGALLVRRAVPAPASASASAPAATRAAGASSAADWPIIAGRQARLRRGRALLVDTRDSSLRFLAHELDACGVDVQRVHGGNEAVQRMQQEAFDFVFLASGTDGDKRPDLAHAMDGFQACELLQRLPPAQPVAPPPTRVLLLADDDPVSRLRAEQAGADAWLAAPWDAQSLLRIVDERQRRVQPAPPRS